MTVGMRHECCKCLHVTNNYNCTKCGHGYCCSCKGKKLKDGTWTK